MLSLVLVGWSRGLLCSGQSTIRGCQRVVDQAKLSLQMVCGGLFGMAIDKFGTCVGACNRRNRLNRVMVGSILYTWLEMI